jgi:hypothetical protein
MRATMRRPSPHDNPFDLNKASDFSDSEIAEQWVDIANATGGLLGILKPTLRMPMLLLGGKGSGKTHLMRYCSAPVQATRRGGDLVKAIEEDGYLGIYIRADALNTDKFANGGQSVEYWTRIFSMYFELWLATALISAFADYLSAADRDLDERGFITAVAALFDADVSGSFVDIATLTEYLTRVRKNIDFAVNNSLLRGEQPDVQITFSPGQLVFGIPELIGQRVATLADVLIVYLIDEVENLTAEQQKFLNSLMRYRRGNATIKLGTRLYGIKTYDTLGSGEPIKRDAEYERVELDRLLREQRAEYYRFVSRLVVKRLQSFGFAASDGETAIASHFAELDRRNYWKAVEEDLLRGHDKQVRPFHHRLLRDLTEIPGVDEDKAAEVVAALSVAEHLFLDKAATFYFRKNWPKRPAEALDLAGSAACQARALEAGNKAKGADLRQLIAHFDSDILAQLYHDYRQRVPYAGFETMVDLSQGIARNLLTNLKHIYRRSQFAGEEPFAGGVISIKSQSDGVRDGAAWFWEDAQPPSGGLQVRDAVESLAVLFRTVRLSHAPAECDLCTFSVAVEDLTENSVRTLQIAENWSYLVRLADGRRNKNSRSVDEKYQLGPMLAPRWEVSEHRRGSIELGAELANAILDPEHRAALPGLLRRRLARMLAPPREKTGRLL